MYIDKYGPIPNPSDTTQARLRRLLESPTAPGEPTIKPPIMTAPVPVIVTLTRLEAPRG